MYDNFKSVNLLTKSAHLISYNLSVRNSSHSVTDPMLENNNNNNNNNNLIETRLQLKVQLANNKIQMARLTYDG